MTNLLSEKTVWDDRIYKYTDKENSYNAELVKQSYYAVIEHDERSNSIYDRIPYEDLTQIKWEDKFLFAFIRYIISDRFHDLTTYDVTELALQVLDKYFLGILIKPIIENYDYFFKIHYDYYSNGNTIQILGFKNNKLDLDSISFYRNYHRSDNERINQLLFWGYFISYNGVDYCVKDHFQKFCTISDVFEIISKPRIEEFLEDNHKIIQKYLNRHEISVNDKVLRDIKKLYSMSKNIIPYPTLGLQPML